MARAFLGRHDGLAAAGRLPALAWRGARAGAAASAAELAALAAIGAAAAFAAAFADLDLRVPGHSVLRAVFPMALGLALVPRRAAGTVMGAAALATAFALPFAGGPGIGAGAMTSLALTGPLLDAALRRARGGRAVYVGCVLAGLASNAVAFGVRLVAKLAAPSGRPVATWLPESAATYALCGALAGLVSAAVWFRFSARRVREGGAT